MFDFFKKNQPLKAVKEKISVTAATPGSPGGPEAALKESVKIDNIIIHVMPDRFRNQPVKQSSAKTTGLLIIIGGTVFLLVASVALYYFLFSKPSPAIIEKPVLVPENNQPLEAGQIETEVKQIPENQESLIASGTEAILPSLEQAATTTQATTTPIIEPAETELSLRLGTDSDNDGLTDIEEIFLGANAAMSDTDGDGYMDGAELMNLYNPAGAGKLTENSNISLYENKTFGYNLLYPSAWQTGVNGGDDSLMFKSGDNQFVQAIVQPNANKQTLDAWYMEQLGVLTISENDRVEGSNWQGLKSSDGLNIYFMDSRQNYIFNLTYNSGGSNILEYLGIFQMMVKSFNLKD